MAENQDTPWWSTELTGKPSQESLAASERYFNERKKLLEETGAMNRQRASAAAAQSRANFERYAQGRKAYGENRRGQILGDWRNLTQQYVGGGRNLAEAGDVLASDIDRMYADLANRQVAAYNQANQPSVDNTVGGLRPVSGEAAMAGQMLPATGSNLGTYLEQQFGVRGAGLYDLARAQQEQGMSYAQNYIDQILSEIEAERYANEQRAASMVGSANAALEQALLENELMQIESLYGTEGLYTEAARDLATARGSARGGRAMADRLLQIGAIKPSDYNKYLKIFGVNTSDMSDLTKRSVLGSELRNLATQDPRVFAMFLNAQGVDPTYLGLGE